MDGQDTSEAGSVLDRLSYDELRALVRSERGIAAVMRATTAGDPSVARVHQLLVEQFGRRYASDSSAVLNAGLAVAELMREFGFVEDRRGRPAGPADGGLRWRMPSFKR